ncbi:Hypothetical predicted protein [Paramuricea clavata]|uniref:Uncharacterized protein n=1 Tax=Paramuricea clavata TaxID=317549 RepID=A0A6S7HXV9_PARCT|nr:Hypothetical predicted protein [Paramuricea clavata]
MADEAVAIQKIQESDALFMELSKTFLLYTTVHQRISKTRIRKQTAGRKSQSDSTKPLTL